MAQTLLSFGILLISAHLVLCYFPDEWETSCKKQNGFEGDIGKMNYEDPSFPRSAKCYMACFMEKQQVMKPDGTIDIEYAKGLYKKVHKDNEKKVQLFHRIVSECATEYKVFPDKCDTAFSYVKCKRTKYAAYA